ncbi:MAG: divalent-cation tolerance protein CutA [Chloroflexi bacterium]|nr:divalent-cation tolerance protein CutA [Chloroflexota bacterium]
MADSQEYVQILTTTEYKDDASKIARQVVEGRLAACVQIIGPITSTYWWDDAVQEDEEYLCLIKSRADRVAQLKQTIAEVHPYDVPELLVVPVLDGGTDYLEWISEQVRPSDA